MAERIWDKSTMLVLHEDDEAYRWPCQVRIGDNEIVVSYDDDGLVTYSGAEVEPGHWRLEARGVKGRATLHRFRDAETLEGSWTEDGYGGMWSIELGRSDEYAC